MSALQEIDRRAASQSHVTGVMCGLADIDCYLGGFQRGQLLGLAARPSMGKTNLALTIALGAAKTEPAPVAFFSLDRTRHEVIESLLCGEAAVPLRDVLRGNVTSEARERLAQSVAELERLPLFIDDTCALTVPDIRRSCERLAAHRQLSMVFVDYLQLVVPAPGSREANREDELAEICRLLKATAQDLHVPVIVLSQLKPEINRRRNKRPLLSDVRDFGLEQEADVVAFLYRDAYYNVNASEPDVAEFIIARNRGGPTGTVKIRFQSDFARFVSYVSEAHLSPVVEDTLCAHRGPRRSRERAAGLRSGDTSSADS